MIDNSESAKHKRRYEFLKNYAIKRGYHEIAEEFASDIFFKHSYQSLKHYFLNYIRDTYRNDKYKASVKRPRHFIDIDDLKLKLPDPRCNTYGENDILITARLLKCLNNTARCMFLLKIKWEFTEDEIAELFGCPTSVVKVTNTRSKKLILSKLTSHDLER